MHCMPFYLAPVAARQIAVGPVPAGHVTACLQSTMIFFARDRLIIVSDDISVLFKIFYKKTENILFLVYINNNGRLQKGEIVMKRLVAFILTLLFLLGLIVSCNLTNGDDKNKDTPVGYLRIEVPMIQTGDINQ
jgi:hypothetical protein